MAQSYVVLPEPFRLTILDGAEWLLVKKRLTAGEARRAFGRQVKRMAVGETTEIESTQVGLSTIVEYLLDWSLVDPAGKPLLIRDRPVKEREALLEGLELDVFNAIWSAIQDHEVAMAAERAAEKKTRSGVSDSGAITASVA
jgi:hypothetical protein